jgi:nucleotide-binding universal stress UspA family protein
MKILFATDGSEYSEAAARFLVRLNLSADDEIIVFHAVSWIPLFYEKESYYNNLKEIKKEIAPRILDAAVEILRPLPAKISTEIKDGSAEYCVVRVAEEAGMDVIVMGARGVKGVKSLFIGSVTKAVMAASSVPVLVIKPALPERTGRMKVLFATDGSDHSVAVADLLSFIPFQDDTEVTVMNAIWSDFSDIPERFVMEINERIVEDVARSRKTEFAESKAILDQAREVLARRFRDVTILSKIGDPSAEILKEAERSGADLIAVGCRGLRGIKGMMGSVSRNILTHSKCSVLVGKTCKE